MRGSHEWPPGHKSLQCNSLHDNNKTVTERLQLSTLCNMVWPSPNEKNETRRAYFNSLFDWDDATWQTNTPAAKEARGGRLNSWQRLSRGIREYFETDIYNKTVREIKEKHIQHRCTLWTATLSDNASSLCDLARIRTAARTFCCSALSRFDEERHIVGTQRFWRFILSLAFMTVTEGQLLFPSSS